MDWSFCKSLVIFSQMPLGGNSLAKGPDEILLIAPNLLGETLATQLATKETGLRVCLKREQLTKHPSVLIWSLDSFQVPNTIFIELKKLEEEWNPSPLLLLLPKETKLTKEELFEFGVKGLLQDPDLKTLKEAIKIVKGGGRFLKVDQNQTIQLSTQQPWGLGQWLLISGLQQIDKELISVDGLIKNYSHSIIPEEILRGRLRELKAAKYLLIKFWGPISSTLNLNNQITESAKGSMAINLENNQSETYIKLIKTDPKSIWKVINNYLREAIETNAENKTGELLAIEGLNPNIREKLLLSLHFQLDKAIERLQEEDYSQKHLKKSWPSLEEQIRRESLRDISGNYLRIAKDGERIPVAEELMKISDFRNGDNELPEATMMLNPVINDNPIIIDGKLLPTDDPRALTKIQILYSNWLVRNAEILSGEILSACAQWAEIRSYFLKNNLISTRELERRRNHINNKNRWVSFIERPIQIYESKRLLYKFTAEGIETFFVTEPRDEELRQLGWWQQQITLLVETRDAIAPQIQALIKKLGDLMVVLLTQILGRSLGLIGRGIAQGMGKSFGRS